MQGTLLSSVQVKGFGFWLCNDVVVTITPAETDSGITFIRTDLPGKPAIPAVPENYLLNANRTSLAIQTSEGKILAEVDMVEHILAAFYAVGVTNAVVSLTGQELPALDGSAKPWVEMIIKAGVTDQGGMYPSYRIQQPIRITGDRPGVYLEVLPPEKDVLQATVDYELNYADNPAIGQQHYTTVLEPSVLQSQIMPARTFATQQEAFKLQASGMCRRVTYDNCLIFALDGVIQNELRFPDECARHKILDLIGDISLGGVTWVGQFHACGSGHALNFKLLMEMLKQRETSALKK